MYKTKTYSSALDRGAALAAETERTELSRLATTRTVQSQQETDRERSEADAITRPAEFDATLKYE